MLSLEMNSRSRHKRSLLNLTGAAVISFAAMSAAFARDAAPETDVASEPPLHMLVSLDEQKIKVYRGLDLIEVSSISSGKRGHSTPTGVFSILEKRRKHFSNLYDNAPMPFMQRLTWSGIALHVEGCPAIRLRTVAFVFRKPLHSRFTA